MGYVTNQNVDLQFMIILNFTQLTNYNLNMEKN
jgi:hypothetical protein